MLVAKIFVDNYQIQKLLTANNLRGGQENLASSFIIFLINISAK